MAKGDHTAALSFALDATEELRLFIELAHIGLDHSKDAIETDSLLKELGYRDKPSSEESEKVRSRQLEKLQTFAQSQHAKGFPFLYALGIIRACSILEIAVFDFVHDVLVSEESIRHLPAFVALKGPIVQFAAATSEEQSKYLIEALSDQLGTNLKRGPGRFESLLNAIALGGPIDPRVRPSLVELVEIRNLLVHRGGKTDKKFIDACSWLNIEIGSDLPINRGLFDRCYSAAMWYLLELLRRETVKYPTNDPKAATAESICRFQEILCTRGMKTA
jgi:hypothetical protein